MINIIKARSVLITLLIGILALNAGLFLIGYKVTTDSQPQKLENLRDEVVSNEIEVTNQLFLSKLDGFISYALASDDLLSYYKILIGIIALSNTFLSSILNSNFINYLLT